jgi:hypothetical protein
MHDGIRSVYPFSPPLLSFHLGLSLRQAWYNALNDAQTSFRLLLTSTSSPDWKRVPLPRDSNSLASKGKGRSSLPDLSDVIVHRRSSKSEDTVYRVVLDVPAADDTIPFDVWKSVLATPELRQEWDPAVDGAALLEMLDPTTRISKTNFTLGWPAKCVRHPSSVFTSLINSNSPRDAVTISRIFNDATTVIDVSTSLPRSPDEPAYLRPSPPYVRSNVKREDTSRSIEHVGLTMSMQYSHGVSNLYPHPHLLSLQILVTLRERRIQGACASHASGSTIFVHYGTLAPSAAWLSSWPPWSWAC